ncbi:response regulator [Oceaniglobus roseus]|uniref:response regulator n=1 Tax=Oceaniglobus roseus TaxID=1737570 RepID=UPI000C7EF3E3|nr:response regulator transcription factor [Kandeliimicrobium roseum]
MRLLVVEDEVNLAGAVVDHLRARTHAVDWAATLDEAAAAVRTADFDLVLLDLSLPDGDGLSLLREMRDRTDRTPVVIATARDRIMERIAGLEAGADDYILKPYDLDELSARIAAIRRRAGDMPTSERRFGALVVDPEGRAVHLDGQPVALTRKEWAVLDRLSRRPDTTVTREQLEQAVYGFDDEVESNAIEVHVSRLRAKLGRAAVETVRGFGYRMGRG